ncbi:PH domain-containing protein [Flavobacterium sp. xlx-214]|uniref:PH domain-containing protein n=1 Tax=unclassified Flavobacterium TaxID=196869 RepID=UPI0013D2BB18|nr:MULTISPECIES: PH domain-containing protein [unclassified Flavobacterium]MBA5793152.1 PH domain-containing protein [Flavobacterium sp. xlx-221]QMI82564.1 PH domain-containing protein [Flavobacterium sp. xlx-214]
MNQKDNFDFSQPNSLNPKAFWLSVAKSMWTVGKSFFPILIVLGINRDFSSKNWWVYLLPVFLILISVFSAFIKYRFFKFQVENDELILKTGWLNKEQTVVKFDKIHEVNLNQKFLHKILGLYNVSIDTAGSATTEIEINGISFQKALTLKDVLTQKRSVVFENDVNETPLHATEEEIETKTIKIGLSSLIKIGLTRNYLQTFGLLIAFGYQIADQLQSIFYKNEESIYDDIYSKASEYYVGLLWIVLILVIIVVVVLFNLVRTLLMYYNYHIQLKNNQLLVSFGLTDSHIISVPSNKVQLFQFQQNYFQKVMNLFEVKIKQVESNENNKKKKGLIVPGANWFELNELFKVIYSKDLDINKTFIKPHIRSLYLKLVAWAFVFSLFFIALFIQKQYNYLLTPVLVYLAIAVLLFVGYKNKKLYIENDFIVLKQGIWDVTTTYLDVSKVQQIMVSQSVFQKKRQLGSVTLSTAGGSISLNYYHYPTLQKLANEWLYQIEKNKYKWM